MVMPSVSRSRNLISILSSISKSVLVNSLVICKIDQTLGKQATLRFIYNENYILYEPSGNDVVLAFVTI